MTLDTAIEEASYLVGYQQAQGLSQQAAGAIDMQAYLQGAADFVAGGESQVSAAEQARLMQALQEAVSAKQMEASAGVRAAGDQYRAEFAAQEGVVELESGLLYEVITQGTGEKPTAGRYGVDALSRYFDRRQCVFDSSVERGQPATFPVNGVIAGWTEALQLMPVGSKWRLVLPPELAYGDRGRRPGHWPWRNADL